MIGRAKARTVAAVLVALMVASGCSSDEGAGPPGTEPVDTAEDSGAAPQERSPGGAPLARYADHQSENYDDESHWVCRPDTEDICDSDLTTTVVNADGTTRIEEFTPAEDPPIDCFYVYPTISRDESSFSDWEASPEEEGYVTLQQAARLREVCRVFAPVYRQRTLTSLATMLAGDQSSDDEEGNPFADVLDAFRTYMSRDNSGRGVVLIGHSQGSGMLTRLIAEEIDPNDDVRDLLVGAYLVGSSVVVPDGEVVGGVFQNVPLCSSAGETGCVMTWATFRATSPPPQGALFGAPRDGKGVAGCVNPAAVEGGSAELHGYYPADPTASILSTLGADADAEGRSWAEGTTVDTPFVSLPGLVTGQCVSREGYNYLEVVVHGDPEEPRVDDIGGDLTPEWGLHLVDVSIVMGDIVDRVRDQAEAFTG